MIGMAEDHAIRLPEDHAIRLPFTQTDLADMLGLTSVHTACCRTSGATR